MEPNPAEASNSQTRYRPYPSADHKVSRGRYITSNDARGFIPVYEYPLNGQWIMMDADDGYVLWTGIWKALGNSKADIVRMLEARPDWAPQVRRVRGGYLKIQGTWLPYETARMLSCRVAWPIRNDLIPLFGPSFPDQCLSPGQPGYGQVLPSLTVRRKRRPATAPANNTSAAPGPSTSAAHASPAHSPTLTRVNDPGKHVSPTLARHAFFEGRSALARAPSMSPRFAPYPSGLIGAPISHTRSPPLTAAPIMLPPIQLGAHQGASASAVRLPPIFSLATGSPGYPVEHPGIEDARDVLRRLREPDAGPTVRNERRDRSLGRPPSDMLPPLHITREAPSYPARRGDSTPSARRPTWPPLPSVSLLVTQPSLRATVSSEENADDTVGRRRSYSSS